MILEPLQRRFPRRERRPLLLLTSALLAASVLSPGLGFAGIREDLQFADYLKRLRYYDTTERWLAKLERRYSSNTANMAQIESRRIDLLKAQGKPKEQEYLKKLEEFKRKYPEDSRANLAGLEAIELDLKELLDMLDKTISQPPEKSKQVADEVLARFKSEIEPKIEELIASLAKKLEEAQKAHKRDAPEIELPLRLLHQAELARVKITRNIASRAPREHAERKTLLAKGLKLAETFVNDRSDFPVMQYEAQLMAGLFQYELENWKGCEEALSLLYDASPPLAPPFSNEILDAFWGFRLQSGLFGARSSIAAGKAQRAVDTLEKVLNPKKGDPMGAPPEREPLRTYKVLALLEQGVAMAAGGKSVEGLQRIHKIIDDPKTLPGLVTDARKALARLAQVGGVGLSGGDYYQAALGLKSEYRFPEALGYLQLALANLSLREGAAFGMTAVSIFNEIGEINYIQGNTTQAALSYSQATRHFSDAVDPQLRQRIAQNFSAAVSRAINERGDMKHPGLVRMREAAERLNEQYGGALTAVQLKFSESRRLEQVDANYEEAAKGYREIPREVSSKVGANVVVKQYWLAQASAYACECMRWLTSPEDQRAKYEAKLDGALAGLEKVLGETLPLGAKDGASEGAKRAAFTLGWVNYEKEQWEQAAKHLIHFAETFRGDKDFGGQALVMLCVSEVRLGKAAEAGKHFAILDAEPAYKDLASVATAAREVADGYSLAGEPKLAAEHILKYAKHPATSEEIAKPDTLVTVSAMLIEGGLIAEAADYIERLKKQGGNGAPAPGGKGPKKPLSEAEAAIARQVVYLEGKLLAYQKKWSEVIAKLDEGYLREFNPQNDYAEDAYVLRDIAEAYLARDPSGKPSKDDIKKADGYYGVAAEFMLARGENDKSLYTRGGEWLLRFLELHLQLADLGDGNACRQVLGVLTDKKEQIALTGMAEKFEAIRKRAEAGVKKK